MSASSIPLPAAGVKASSRTSVRRICVAVFLAAFALRVALVFLTDQAHQFPRKEMVRTAITFAQRGELADPFTAPTGPTAHVPPAYPIFLGLLFKVFGTGPDGELVKCILTSAVSAFRCALLVWLAVWLGLSRRTAIVAGILSIAYVGALTTEIKGDWEAPYAALVLIGLFCAAMRVARDANLSVRRGALLGVAWGAALLMTPSFLTVLGGFLLAGALVYLKRAPFEYLRFAAALGVVMALMLAPWAIRNQIRLGSPVWAKDNLGIELLVAYHPGSHWSLLGTESWTQENHPSRQPAVARQLGTMGEIAFNKMRMEQAKEWIRANPGETATLTAQHAIHFWFPVEVNPIHTGLEWLLTLAAAAGMWLFWGKNRTAAALIASMWIFYPLLYWIVVWSSRYRYPLNWTLILMAAVTIDRILTASYNKGADRR